jgi:NAD(P)-dependent dehydrogenase (short-subunit alcohol dehydrogenase family)
MKKTDVVFITGASAGLGRAIADEFARQGAHLGLFARDAARLEKARAYAESCGARALAVPGDVADPAALENAAEAVERTFGPIDIWINNAMTTVFAPFWEVTPEEYKRVTEVTYLGYVYGTMAALKRMRPRNRGSIVQVGSALASRSIPLQSAYCGAKHAIQGFTDSLRSELLHEKSAIKLSMVQMPALNTPQFDWCEDKMGRQPQPVPPIYQPEVAARAVHWAAYHRNRELNVGIRTSLILWGNKFFPGFGDRYLATHGYSGQFTKDTVPPDRPSDLWQPVAGDYGAHGRFDDRAIRRSRFLELKTRIPGVWKAAGAGVCLLALAVLARRSRA